jgi:hypothetical protein
MTWINKLFSVSGDKHRWPKFRLSKLSEHTRTWHVVKDNPLYLTGCSNESQDTKILTRDNLSVKEERWIFRVLSGVDQGREYVAITKEIRIGRHPENLILLRDPKASRFHAIIYRKDSRLVLEDLASTNGTRVNGEIVLKKRTLFSGDLIKIGETVIGVSLEKN